MEDSSRGSVRFLYHPSASIWVVVQANKLDFIEFVSGDLEGDRNFTANLDIASIVFG